MLKHLKHKPYSLTAVDLDILQLVREFHFITVESLIRLKYSKGTKTTVQTKLKCLYENKYLDRRALPDVKKGNTEYIYALSTKSINILKEQGFTGFSRFRPDEFRQFAFPHLQHALSVSDVMIAARLLNRDVPSISIASMIHDLNLKRVPVRVTFERRLPGGGMSEENYTIIPDLWVDARMVVPGRDKPRRRCIVLELDRGSEDQKFFRRRIRAYVAYAVSKEYQELFETDLCIVAYAATTAGDKRLKQMIAWCEQELEQQQLEHESNLFRFTSLPAGEYNPREIFCSERWYKPFEPEPVSLLWKL